MFFVLINTQLTARIKTDAEVLVILIVLYDFKQKWNVSTKLLKISKNT
jgi:hypothetical protein